MSPSHYKLQLLLLYDVNASFSMAVQVHIFLTGLQLCYLSCATSCMLASVAVHLAVKSGRSVLHAGCTLPPAGLRSKTRNPT